MRDFFRLRKGACWNVFLVPLRRDQYLNWTEWSIQRDSLLSDLCISPSFPAQGRPNGSWADAVGGDSFRSPFKCCTARQAEKSSLASTIGCMLIESNVSSLACDVHNAARWRLTCSAATTMDILCGEECSRKCLARECRPVEIHHVVFQAVLRRCLFERTQRNVAGGVDEDRWESGPVLGDGLECFCHGCRIGHIARVCFDAVVLASAHRSVHAIENGLDLASLKWCVQESKFGTLGSQESSNGRANAACESNMLVRRYTWQRL